MEQAPVRAASAQVTEAAKRILRHFHPDPTEKIQLTQAMSEIDNAVRLGRVLREAVEKATTDGVVQWDEAAAILIAKRKAE